MMPHARAKSTDFSRGVKVGCDCIFGEITLRVQEVRVKVVNSSFQDDKFVRNAAIFWKGTTSLMKQQVEKVDGKAAGWKAKLLNV